MDEMDKKSDIAKREEETLAFWNEKGVFEKSLAQTAGGEPFTFYDGPPFANGLPHYGHILASVIKDAIPRYQTMQGRYVRRVWGWDCHGLPVENLIEKELGLKNKKDIEEYGIGKFNQAAEASVLRYDAEWKKMIPRLGRWIDMGHAYRTMDANYTESVWWAFKTLYEKNLIYQGFKTMQICPRCETTLSNNEVSDGYKDITDISITVKFELVDEPGTFVLAWTTTPWTLPGNVALAIKNDNDKVPVTYRKITIEKIDGIIKSSIIKEGETYIFLDDLIIETNIFGDKINYDGNIHDVWHKKQNEEVHIFLKNVETLTPKDLIGKSYKPVFDYYSNDKTVENHGNGWKIYGADFVTMDSGTGVVHIAPAFGEDDMALGKKENLPFIQHVAMDGTMKKEVCDFIGVQAKPKGDHQATDILIIKHLAGTGALFSKEKIIHSYPHCWRCDTPLLNYAAESWFVKVADLKEKLLLENATTKWVPENMRDGRFGKWLEGARDWAISRSRFWGAPLPVWNCTVCDKREVAGSRAELASKTKKSGNKYFVMRHGEAESNATNIISTRVENPTHLTEKGKIQAEETAKKLSLEKIEIIFSSDFIRTRETAEIIATNVGISKEEIIYDARLREVNAGDFDGQNVNVYRSYFSSYGERYTKRPPEGETLMEVKCRIMSFLDEVEAKYSGKTILFVTHENPAFMFLSGSLGLNIEESATMRYAEEEYFNTGEVIPFSYTPFPHNANFEFDVHRPYIDELPVVCDCGGAMKRVEYVFDCWFESGSMPYAQFHYPFENKELFEKNFPANFIAEGVDQTRGWFYSLLVLSVGLFGRTPFQNVIVNGMVLAEDGKQKLSKKLKNYPDPAYIINSYGADALRYYLLSSPIVHAEDLAFTEKGVDEVVKKVIARLLNVLSFYELYGNDSEEVLGESKNPLDLWILARLAELGQGMTTALDAYELDRAVKPIGLFVDDLSTWYLRRSRDRFKSDDIIDRAHAIATTRTVFLEFSKLLAPVMPFLAEHLYQTMNGDKESVHLEKWPKFKELEQTILDDMKKVRHIVSQVLEARVMAGIKVRQPLASVKLKNLFSKELQLIIADELNVKEVICGASSLDVLLDLTITPELKREGQFRELVRTVQELRKTEGLIPSDTIVLTIRTNDVGSTLVKDFENELKKTALIREILFGEVSVESVNIDGIPFAITLKK